MSARVRYSLALHENGTLYGWGAGAQGTNVLYGWTPTPQDPAIRHIPGDTFTAIAAGNVHALAIRHDGTVTGWGNNNGGALDAPSHVSFAAVDAGWGYSVGIANDRTLWGWGSPHTFRDANGQNLTQPWTFASQGWAQYGSSQHYYVPG
ncbi:hypothetical protein BH23GEM2_BH23GEM2_26020 [soil metagenome]